MITVRDRGIRWGHEDVRQMAKIIGPEHAVIPVKESYGWAPKLPSILRLADRKRCLLSGRAKQMLRDAQSLRDEVRELKRLEDAKISDPKARKYFPHQRADLHWMYSLNLPSYLLAHQPGIGKTLVAIRFGEYHKAKRIAVITTNSGKDQWRDEIRRWRTRALPIKITKGSIDEQVATIKSLEEGWVIGHWESLVTARDGWLDAPWDLVILDEAQHIQNRNAQRTDTVHALKSTYRLALSGHPYANAVKELFPILKFLYPKIYPSFWRWAHLQIQIDEGAFGAIDLSTPRRPKLLKWEIAPFMLRRTKQQVWKNLPPISRKRVTVELSKRGRREYDKLRKQFFVELEAHAGEKNILAIPSVLARITRLRQYLIDPAILGAKEPSVKYPAVLDLIREMTRTPPVIFTMYKQAALRLSQYLGERDLTVGVMTGGMQGQIHRIKSRFLKHRYDALIVLIQVGGTVLNLGKFGQVIYLDMPWNERDVEQTEGRVYRPEEGSGIIIPTLSNRVMVADSYEDRMEDKRQKKHLDFGKVFTVSDAKELFA